MRVEDVFIHTALMHIQAAVQRIETQMANFTDTLSQKLDEALQHLGDLRTVADNNNNLLTALTATIAELRALIAAGGVPADVQAALLAKVQQAEDQIDAIKTNLASADAANTPATTPPPPPTA